jgi:precorrin-3B C17-methyltransferase
MTPAPCRPRLFIIGTGPGDAQYLAPRARTLLETADAVAGYTTYIDLIKPIIKGKPVISTGMTKEVERVEKAIETALEGRTCALVSGGDAGIYAMAGLVFELCRKKELKLVRPGNPSPSGSDHKRIEIEVVPGIPALAAGASLLGAPLTHDFAAVSLSDLLTPWETIEKRLEAAAMADFVIAIYNPKSKKRDWQLSRAKEIIMKYRDKTTPVGIVTSAMRDDQAIRIATLDEMDRLPVGMQTTVFVGNTTSVQYLDFMVTPRGYSTKYKL